MSFSKTICLVDDDPDYRLLVKLFFKRYYPDLSVCLYADGNALLTSLPTFKRLPDLILLDRHMAGFDGHQVLEVLKRHSAYRRIPVVMMSAEASREEIRGCYDAGVSSFLIKSMDGLIFRKILNTICEYWLGMNQAPDAV